MKNQLNIDKKINSFKKTISVEGDKSLSIRWVLLSSLSKKKSTSYNLLKSEDVLSAISCIEKLGAKVRFLKNKCEITGTGFNLNINKKIILNAGNSGTLGRLILGLLINTTNKIELRGDKSLSKRDFSRVTAPLEKFGAKFNKKKNLPLIMQGLTNPRPINYLEKKGSAQCKTTVMLAALKSNGFTKIKAKKSRNHTELLFKHLNIPIQIKNKKNYDIIKVKGVKKLNPINYKIPGDISSCAFFIVLTLLSKKSKLLIKSININPSRIGIIKILKKMGAEIKFINQKTYKGEKISDILVKSSKNLKSINCPIKYNSSAIDEFLIIFLVAAKSKGISFFKNLSELNQKESPRLVWASKILNLMGVKNVVTKSSLKIFGNPNLTINKEIVIKDFYKDHRIFMMSVIAALSFGGKWKIHDIDSIKTSFPKFLEKIREIKR
ncbi:MAG: 3-phosphoshikimate 1-carboxyvinyltransferase [Candidatus Pelagibacter sp.]|nr:3-phosphoshikimate 1-carboxyvinyltransferase [Candidatus Pelagibacter sp.]